jgi:ParB family chromosome partitioning protein
MAKPMGGLGRGLGALIPQQPIQTQSPDGKIETVDVASSLRLLDVSPDSIVANPHQPRKEFSSAELEDLLASIKEHGILQPLVVTEKSPGEYELIAGERRLRSSRMLGLKKVPVIVRSATDQEKLELALVENIQRQQLNAVEEARAYEGLADIFDLTQEQIAQRVGKSRSFVANTMRLLELDEEILSALSGGKITRSHARTLLSEPDAEKRKALFEQMLAGKMTVRQAEAKAGNGTKKRNGNGSKDPNIVALEDELREALGTKVGIDMKNGSGKVTLHFYSKEELKSLIKKLTE